MRTNSYTLKPDNISIDIWTRFQKGDSKAFSDIYYAYAQSMYAYGVCFTTDRELVKDCIHEVFVKVYNNRDRLNLENMKFYLIRAMKNELYNAFRNEKDTCQIEEQFATFSPVYSVEDAFIKQEHQMSVNKDVMKMLDSLTPHQKEVIYYRYIEELSIQEIAELMHMNYQSVQNIIQRSITKLRKEFSPALIVLLIPCLFSTN